MTTTIKVTQTDVGTYNHHDRAVHVVMRVEAKVREGLDIETAAIRVQASRSIAEPLARQIAAVTEMRALIEGCPPMPGASPWGYNMAAWVDAAHALLARIDGAA